MPRRTLKFVQGGYYHIYNRGAGRQSIFRVDENYRYLLEMIGELLPTLQLTLIAYCLLPNHYHWLVRQDGEIPAGLLAQRVFNRYATSFNNRYGRKGTLFESRYKAKPVLTDDYLRQLCLYIHANPVRHGLAMTPDLWPYSNYPEWTGQRPGKLVDHDFVRTTVGSGSAYADMLNAYLTGQVYLPAELKSLLDQNM